MKLKEICSLVGGRLEGDPEVEIQSIKGIEEAEKGDITFLSHKKYLPFLENSECFAVISPEQIPIDTKKSVIYVKNPYLAFAKLLEIFYPAQREKPKVSSRSVISDSAKLGKDVTIYPLVFVGEGAVIGDGSTIYSGAFIGEKVTIGPETIIHPNVSLYHDTIVGSRVIIHAGAVIGSDGFGYAPDETGKRHKIPQKGNVVIEDDVEIGANTCIDRATLGETRIKKGVKLDNMVQIAHNCVVEEDAVMAAQVGVSGSCQVGKRVMLGGQVGVADHVKIGNDTMIVAQSGVPSDLEGKKIYAGSPTVDRNTWRKSQISLLKLPDLIKKVRSLEKQIEELKKND